MEMPNKGIVSFFLRAIVNNEEDWIIKTRSTILLLAFCATIIHSASVFP